MADRKKFQTDTLGVRRCEPQAERGPRAFRCIGVSRYLAGLLKAPLSEVAWTSPTLPVLPLRCALFHQRAQTFLRIFQVGQLVQKNFHGIAHALAQRQS